MIEVIKVGIADMNLVHAPHLIRTTGLGSCVGVIVYDTTTGIAGLVHVMLPDSSIAKDAANINKAKFADTAVQALVTKLINEGCNANKLRAKIAGGAEMFSFVSNNDAMKIGPRNVEAVKKALRLAHIRLVAEDTGGNSGRTIQFNPDTTTLEIRTVNQGIKVI